MSGIEHILKTLNSKQKEAVESKNQRTLILAGAGSGKTKVLTSRVAYLINLGVEPTSILSVTFTNKAAGEMKTRIVNTLQEVDPTIEVNARDLSVGTFHSLCARWIRTHALTLGLSQDFTIIDQDEQKSFVKEILDEKLKYGREAPNPKEKTKIINALTKQTLSLIGYYKDEGIRPEDMKFSGEDYQRLGFDFKHVYTTYEEEREKRNLLDFGDLLLYMVELLRSNAPIRRYYNDLFRHILVDEFQDTNKVQAELIDLLHDKKEGYLFVVGDDDQSIYEWRGANIENILGFDKTYKGVKTVRLEQNYRSTNNILKCANGLIERNKKRKGKNLWSEKPEGDKVIVNAFDNAYDEADRVAREIKKGLSLGLSPVDYAILYRSNHMSRIIEQKLNEHQIAYTIIGGIGFWSRLEIKDIMSYLTLCVNTDNDMAFDRVINTPTRSMGKKKLEQIKAKAAIMGSSRFEALKSLVEDGTFKKSTQVGKNALNFIELIEKVSNEDSPLEDKLSLLLDGTNIVEFYKDKDEEKGQEREFNLIELVNAAKHFKNEFPEVERDEVAFISYAILQSTADKENEDESVPMMTIHAAKGLEFKRVYAIGWEDGMFPSSRAIEEGKIEEERRLAYVAITRAEDKLTISYANVDRFSGSGGAMASRFIFEMPKEQVEMKSLQKRSKQSNYFSNNRATNDWNKERIISGYKVGAKYTSDKFGEGIILAVMNSGEMLEIKVKFGGMIGIKAFLVERKK
jgi:DNA helicase-2/ATP-dependent DNA helicase PcrA